MSEEINDNLIKYAERVNSFREQFQKWTEVEVKKYLIEPLLTALLWDPTDPNFVRHEFPVTMGSETKKVDYALMSGDTPICVVEAKAGDLDEVAARQALSYARNLSVPWALVTNGQRLRLYGVDFSKGEDVVNALVMDTEISPTRLMFLDYLKYLANGTLDSKEAYNVFKTFNERQTLLVFLQSKKEALVKDIAKWIEEHWSKGSVDEASLLAPLGIVFGRVERIKEGSTEGQASITRTTVVAGDFKYRRDLGEGIFELEMDPTKRIDVSLAGPNVECQLEKLGLRLSSKSAFGGFYYNLRREADLIRRRS
ncbi:MAG: type I restriction enzyme HsdR N-terminal domain-containing protein [Candidatus Omnitrophica bacterium]|nr:type I restriction enzyme HsdR N-terminal domain-containing protein [Candidatus Omnitrophota bacterium]